MICVGLDLRALGEHITFFHAMISYSGTMLVRTGTDGGS